MDKPTTTYRVVVTLEDGPTWNATVAGLAGVRARSRSLAAMDTYVRDAIALAVDDLDVEAEDLDLTYDYRVGLTALDQVTGEIRAERARLADAERKLLVRTAAAAEVLTGQLGLGVRDASILLSVSPGRISQLAPRTR